MTMAAKWVSGGRSERRELGLSNRQCCTIETPPSLKTILFVSSRAVPTLSSEGLDLVLPSNENSLEF